MRCLQIGIVKLIVKLNCILIGFLYDNDKTNPETVVS